MSKLFKAACLLAAATLLAACQKNSYSAYALTSTGTLLQFDTKNPANINSEVTLSGLSTGQTLVQMDYRPADGTLYGITSDNQLATLDPTSGVVTLLGAGQFTTTTLASPVAAWDPVSDQMRVITAQYNLRINADGTLNTVATQIAFASGDTNNGQTPQLAAIAYTNHVANAATSTLYGLELTTQSLVQVGDQSTSSDSSADSGALHTIGTIGSSFGANAGFNVEVAKSTPYVVLQQSGAGAALYTMDLSSGTVTSVGTIGSGDQTIISLVIVPD